MKQPHPETDTQEDSVKLARLSALQRRIVSRMLAHYEDLYHDLRACNMECGGGQVFQKFEILECPTPKKDCHRRVGNAELHFIKNILRLAELGAFTVEDAAIAYFPLYVEQEAHTR